MPRTAPHRSDDDRQLAALTERARGLLAECSLPEALARLLVDLGDAAAARADQLIAWREAGIPKRTWHRLISSGVLPGSLVGREYLARRRDVAAYVNTTRVEPRVPEQRALAGQSADLAALTTNRKLVLHG